MDGVIFAMVCFNQHWVTVGPLQLSILLQLRNPFVYQEMILWVRDGCISFPMLLCFLSRDPPRSTSSLPPFLPSPHRSSGFPPLLPSLSPQVEYTAYRDAAGSYVSADVAASKPGEYVAERIADDQVGDNPLHAKQRRCGKNKQNRKKGIPVGLPLCMPCGRNSSGAPLL